MMKFVVMILCVNFMVLKNKMLMFYYNLFYLISLMMIFTFLYNGSNMYLSISMKFGVDYYSIWLLILSLWIVGLMFMSLEDSFVSMKKVWLFLGLGVILLVFFLSMDLMLFYLMFEISLIPTFFLIIYWGGNPERLSAAYYLMIYMLLISFPLLVYIFKFYKFSHSTNFSVVVLKMMMEDISIWVYLMVYLAFYIKMPIYLFHLWLPKAHVEAPVYGSMILAGVLLKMGSYGLVRLLELFVKSTMKFSFIILSVSVVGSLYSSLMCLTQVDMKSLVAYSSVVHMNVMLASLVSMFKLGVLGAYIMMVSHGLCSSGMFYMVNLFYSRTGSRLLFLNKGLMDKLVLMASWWFLLCVMNFSYPFSLNFISEMFMLMVLVNWDYFMIIYLAMICFFSGAYSLYLFSYIQHGGMYFEGKFDSGFLKEHLVIFIHVYPLLFMLLNLLLFI